MKTMSYQSFNVVDTTRQCLPLYTKRFVLYELSDRDKCWYINQITSPFFNKNIKNKFDQKNAVENARKFLDLYFYSVNSNKKECLQLRMVIKDFKSGALVGGITVFYKSKTKSIELGYWIIPNRQGYGIMSEVLRYFLIAFDKILDASFSIHLEIFDNNVRQKSLAIKNSFFEIRRRADNCGTDIVVYGMDRKKFRVTINE